MTLPNTFGTIATGAQEPGAALDQNFQGLGSSVVVQCTATGTNAIALTEVTNAYQPSAYANYQLFSFVVPNTLTGAATLQYRALAALPWYAAGATPAAETQLGSGNATQNQYAVVAYNSALNGGLGGFVTVSSIAGYLEGTWTPTITFGGGSTGLTYSSNAGAYTRIGRLVVCMFQLVLTAKGSSTGSAVLNGLPFTVKSDGPNNGSGGICPTAVSMSSLTSVPSFVANTGATTANVIQTASTGNVSLTDANFTNSTNLGGTIMYYV